MHKKDFQSWCDLKVEINNEVNRPNILVREIRWCSIGHNIGSEIDGKGELFARPVLILKIISSHTCLVLPMTHSKKEGRHIVEIDFQDEKVKIRLDQIKIVDLKRLKSKIGRLSEGKFEAVNKSAKDFLF